MLNLSVLRKKNILYLASSFAVGGIAYAVPVLYVWRIGLLDQCLAYPLSLGCYAGIFVSVLILAAALCIYFFRKGEEKRTQVGAILFLLFSAIPFLLLAEGKVDEQEITEKPVDLQNLNFTMGDDGEFLFTGTVIWEPKLDLIPEEVSIPKDAIELETSVLPYPKIARKYRARSYVFPVINYNTPWLLEPNGNYVVYLPEDFGE